MDKTIGNDVTIRPKAERGTGAFAPGDVIAGRYVVEKVLGEGGMGIVYQCLDKVGGVSVAVKCLPPEVSRNADEMEDIRANYRLVADLHHPNIACARTLEVDGSTGDYYLVMDLARGTSLKRWARRHPDADRDAKLAILRQVAAALDYAHAEKVIHRDVKPENVMVDDDGRVKVLDFGLAAQIRSSQSRTSNTVTSKGGTPGYKSPEQWLGRPQQAPADVYSFGVMAYWLFSGHLPFDGDDPVVLGHAVLSAPVEPIHDLPAHMNAALVKALAKKPEERFASCGAFVDALEGKGNFSRVEHVERVDGDVGARRPAEPGGPRPVAAVKGLLAVALVAALVGGAWWLASGRNGTTGTSGTTGTNVVHVSAVPSVSDVPSAPSANPAKPAPAPVEKPELATPEKPSAPAARKSVAPSTSEPPTKTFILPGGVEMEMIYIAPGSFVMGSPETEDGRYDNETQHQVTLTKGYWVGKYEVTQAQWDALVRANGVCFTNGFPVATFSANGEIMTRGRAEADEISDPIMRRRFMEIIEFIENGGDTSNFPMESISWDDCDALVQALNRNTHDGRCYFLPTEEQWEYACRAGTTGAYGGTGDLDAMGWYRCEENENRLGPNVVGRKMPNAWGLYDMHGNVREWCQNKRKGNGSGRSVRGGCWREKAYRCRSAYRSWDNPRDRDGRNGFRLCCSAGPRETGTETAAQTKVDVDAKAKFVRQANDDAKQKIVDSPEGKKDQEGEYWARRLSMADAYYARGMMSECRKIYDEFFKTVTKPGADMLAFYTESGFRWAQICAREKHYDDAVRMYGNLLAQPLPEDRWSVVAMENVELLLRLAEEITADSTNQQAKKRAEYLAQATKLVDKLLRMTDLAHVFGRAIAMKSHIEILRGNYEKAQGLVNDYMPQLAEIHEAIRKQDTDGRDGVLRVSPMPECRYLLAEAMWKAVQEEAKKPEPNEDLIKDLLFGVRTGGKRNGLGAYNHAINVFVKCPESKWAASAGKMAKAIAGFVKTRYHVELKTNFR